MSVMSRNNLLTAKLRVNISGFDNSKKLTKQFFMIILIFDRNEKGCLFNNYVASKIILKICVGALFEYQRLILLMYPPIIISHLTKSK